MTHHPNRSRISLRSPKAVTLLAFAVLVPVSLTACGSGVTTQNAAETPQNDAQTVTNCGRTLEFTSVPERVVGLAPSQTELLLRLGLAERLAGQAQTETSALPDDVADDASDVPVVSTGLPPAREDLLNVSPDLVVSPTEYEFTAEQGFASLEQLAENNVNAYVATGGCADRRNTAEVTDLLTDIENLGSVLGVEDAASELTAEAQSRLDAVTNAIGENEQPSVAQLYVDGNSVGAIGAGVEADIIRSAGGANVFDPDAPEFENFFAAEINPEEIVERNPDAIVFGVSDKAHEERVRAFFAETFPDVAAVQNDLLIAIPQSDLFPGALGNINAVETIAAQLHPDVF